MTQPINSPEQYPFHEPTKKGMSTGIKILIAAAITTFLVCGGGLAACLAAGGAAVKGIQSEQESKAGDIKSIVCKKNAIGWEAELTITNSGTAKRSYWVHVNLEDGSQRLGEGYAVVNDLAPGQTAKALAAGVEMGSKTAKCVVGDVN